jgi:hypothetical protein
MLTADNAGPVSAEERALRDRREIIAFWGFAAFLIAGAGALGIYALMTYA